MEIADAWCQSLAFGLRRRDRGVFALQSEDIVGILLAAHHANPEEVDAVMRCV
ncbi:hypothetical protein P9139_02830 [Curtobacterium flaccumfaciens]|nr:hypothetical protein P9139_02830 [Curtobacterium flaccumfaciens]